VGNLVCPLTISPSFVQYVDRADAEKEGLIAVTSQGSVIIRVDNTTTLSSSSAGRKSVNIRSTASFEQGLLIADILHMPGSICGVWPAFWTLGADWPSGGEIGKCNQVVPSSLRRRMA
jgi:hypothetical protein